MCTIFPVDARHHASLALRIAITRHLRQRALAGPFGSNALPADPKGARRCCRARECTIRFRSRLLSKDRSSVVFNQLSAAYAVLAQLEAVSHAKPEKNDIRRPRN